MISYSFTMMTFFHLQELQNLTEQLLLPERVLWRRHRGHQGVVFGVSFTEGHQLSCCFGHLHETLGSCLMDWLIFDQSVLFFLT